MNFLAHIYLSGNNPEMRLGSFIADSVKGRDYNDYAPDIKKGILLHRSIDSFTDQHPVIHSCKHLVRKDYKKYSGIIIDIFFDHFLAAYWSNFSSEPLENYARNNYRLLEENKSVLPERVLQFYPFMVQNNWLVMYSTIEGIEKVLQRMPTRTSLPQMAEFGIKVLRENYNLLRNYFFQYMGDVIKYVEENHHINVMEQKKGKISRKQTKANF